MSKISDFFKNEALGIPYWIFALIIVGLLCIIVVTIIIVHAKKKKSQDKNESVQANNAPLMLPEGQPAESKQEAKEEPVAEVKAVEEKPVEEKPAEKEKPAAKTAAKTSASKSSSAKSSTSKSSAANEDNGSAGKVYHISKRKEDNKWQVKAEGADKALRLFFTQADAIQYAKKVAGNQDGRIVVHKESGGFRKINY